MKDESTGSIIETLKRWFSKLVNNIKKATTPTEEDTLSFLHESNPEKEEEMLNSLAKRLLNMGLEFPAVIFLETSKPLAYIGSQLLFSVSSPFFDFIGLQDVSDYLRILEKRENIERLIVKIEEGKQLT